MAFIRIVCFFPNYSHRNLNHLVQKLNAKGRIACVFDEFEIICNCGEHIEEEKEVLIGKLEIKRTHLDYSPVDFLDEVIGVWLD